MADENTGWIGFDLDGTIAIYERGDIEKYGIEHIGDPIPNMINLVKKFLSEGKRVKIMTARISDNEPTTIQHIENWCETHIGQRLEITCIKDMHMICLYDDRAFQVISNEGITMDKIAKDRDNRLQWIINQYDLWSETGDFTFPDGVIWHKNPQ